jgi:hypothetical protein
MPLPDQRIVHSMGQNLQNNQKIVLCSSKPVEGGIQTGETMIYI